MSADAARGVLTRVVTGAALVLAALAVAFAGVREPRVFLLVAAAVAVAGVTGAAALWPARVLAVTPLLVFLAGVKVRRRDAAASLEGQVDAQVMFELAVYGVLALILVAVLFSGKIAARRISGVERAVLAFAAVAGASVLWSHAPGLTLVRAVQLGILAALGMVLLRGFGAERTLALLAGTVTGGVLFFSALAAAVPAARSTIADDRFGWLAVHPIAVALLAGAAFIFALAALLGGSRRVAGIPAWALLVPLGAIIILTRSRGPLLAVLVGVGVLLGQRYLRVWQAQLLTAATILGAIFLVNSGWALSDAATGGGAAAVFLNRGQDATQVMSFNGRLDLWNAVLDVAGQRLAFGYGYQGSRGYLLELFPWAGYAHNALLQTVLDTGLIGTLLLWGAIGAALVQALARRGQDPAAHRRTALPAALLVFLVAGAMTSESFSGAPGFDLLLLLVVLFALPVLSGRRVPDVVPTHTMTRALRPERSHV
jgi:O-antigen ligase